MSAETAEAHAFGKFADFAARARGEANRLVAMLCGPPSFTLDVARYLGSELGLTHDALETILGAIVRADFVEANGYEFRIDREVREQVSNRLREDYLRGGRRVLTLLDKARRGEEAGILRPRYFETAAAYPYHLVLTRLGGHPGWPAIAGLEVFHDGSEEEEAASLYGGVQGRGGRVAAQERQDGRTDLA